MASPLKIVVVEDHDDLREVTVQALIDMGYDVVGVSCAEELDDEAGGFLPDLLVLDLNLPGENGFSLAERMRAAQPDIGIIMVTARNLPIDITRGYTSGADIYLAKPTSLEQLTAAIQALSRRLHPPPSPITTLVLNTVALELQGNQAVVGLSVHDSLLLSSLAKARDHRLETWQLLDLLGKEAEELEKRALAVQIVRLRKKLAEAGAAKPTIKSIRGTGYQLCASLEIHTHGRSSGVGSGEAGRGGE